MSGKAVGQNSMVRIRRLVVCCVALAAGYAGAAIARTTEDLVDAAARGDAIAVRALLHRGVAVMRRTMPAQRR